MAVGHLGNECYDRKCCKQMFVLLCYSTGTNLFRLSEGFEVRLDNSPLFEITSRARALRGAFLDRWKGLVCAVV